MFLAPSKANKYRKKGKGHLLTVTDIGFFQIETDTEKDSSVLEL